MLINDSDLPPFHLFTDKQLNVIDYSLEDLKNTIHALNPNKSHRPDNISVRMLHICGDPILAPLDLIFRNIILTRIYPDPWKLANVTPVHKKDDWFCPAFNVVCVVNVCPVHAVDLN